VAAQLQVYREKLAQQEGQLQRRAQTPLSFQEAGRERRAAQDAWKEWPSARGLLGETPAQIRVLQERLQRAADPSRQVSSQATQVEPVQADVRAFERRTAEAVTQAMGGSMPVTLSAPAPLRTPQI
jgi:hypothetical protein